MTDQTNTPFRWLPQPSAPIWGLLAGIAVNEDDDEYSDDEFSDDEYDKEYEDKDEEDFKDEELKDEVAKDECVKGRNIKGEEFKNEGFKVEAVKAEEHRCGAKSPSVEEKPTVPNLTSLPTPTILPTAYSARYILTAKEEVESALPPTSREQVETPRVLHTELPEPEKNMHPRTPLQLKSSSGSEECRYADKHGSQIPHEERDVTSSAAKDEAANGLLELNRAATET